MDNVILIGMPGSGKSTVGVLLAKAMGFAFVDTDLTLQQREGALLQDLLNTRGVQSFLDLEQEAICSVQCENTVISPGGSCVCRERAMAHLQALGRIIYLSLPLEELAVRLDNISTRGVAMEPGQTLGDLYAQRAPLYRRWADLTVSCAGQSLEETVAAVLRACHPQANSERE